MELNISNLSQYDCNQLDSASTDYPPIKLRFPLQTTLVIIIIYLFPFCFGVFGNISVCLIFFHQKKLRSITNTFLMNLCLNDLIVLCVSIPMTLSAALLEHWVFGEFFCKFLNFTPTLTALVSTFTVATISIERWLFIVMKKKFDRRCTILILVLLWLVSILIASPEFVSRYLQEFAPPVAFPSKTNDLSSNEMNVTFHDTFISEELQNCRVMKIYFCVFKPGLNMRIFSYIVITVQYLVPFLFVSISCYSISRFLKGRMKKMRVYQNHQKPMNVKKNCHETKKSDGQIEEEEEEDDDDELMNNSEIPLTTAITKSAAPRAINFVLKSKSVDRLSQPMLAMAQRRKTRSTSLGNTAIIQSDKSQSHSERRFHRSKKLLICVAALFTVSWLPLTVVQIYLEHHQGINKNGPHFVYAFLLIPCYLISSLSAWMNPVIYNYINPNFRREFYSLYSCCFKRLSKTTANPNLIGNRPEAMMIEQRNFKQNPSIPIQLDDETLLKLRSKSNKTSIDCMQRKSKKKLLKNHGF